MRPLLLLSIILTGCSGEQDGRLRLTGAATYDNQPIAYGEILFTPDGASGNSGPQGIAPIRDGRYDTGTMGFAGGPTIIRVTAFDREGGKLLAVVEIQADLPRESGTHDINVPKAAAKKPVKEM